MSDLHGEVYYPSPEVVQSANVPDYFARREAASQDLESFWDACARELDWYSPWEKVLDESNAPFYKWYVGGKTNIVLNAIERHLKTWRRNKLALIWEGEPGDTRTLSYFALNRELNKFANVLKALGVRKGDCVTIYMGRIIETIVAMLACAKLGAMHSVVYGGFSEDALRGRIEDSKSKVVVTQDGAWLRGNIVKLKDTVDKAVIHCPSVQSVLVIKRTGHEVNMEAGRDHWYHDLEKLPIAQGNCPTEVMDSEDPLFILYTSGTTGKPKAILHTHGGYQVYVSTTMKYAFDIKEDDRWWCAADPGWITGHSYIVYAPLILGATSFIYEGAPTHPYPNRWWQLVERYGISILYTAPTAIRGLMRFGEAWPKRHDLSSLRLLGSVGEPINPEAWRWYYTNIGRGKCPVIDTWWQTETGGFVITPTPVVPLKPGSGTIPFCGHDVDVVNEDGESVPTNEEGYLVLKRPWPGMVRTLLNDDARFVKQYWSKYPGMYLTGDAARKDEDGYIWVIGRTDDVIKVSGYRLGTAEVESALVSHPLVSEAAAIGLPHELKGNAIHAYCILNAGAVGNEELADEIRAHVGKHLGAIAKPDSVTFVNSLPKTRSGKIMRRVLKARALGQPEGDTSTLEE